MTITGACSFVIPPVGVHAGLYNKGTFPGVLVYGDCSVDKEDSEANNMLKLSTLCHTQHEKI